MPPVLHIHLLGEFRIFLDDHAVTLIESPRQQALLAYLLLHHHTPQLRQHLAFTFWPDSTEEQAYTNLRKLFFQLRQALPEADTFLFATSHHIGWRSDAPFSLDVAALEEALTGLDRATSIDVSVVEQILALYRGELLPGCYDDWLLSLRNSLHERVINTLADALTVLETQHEFPVGLRVTEHLLRLDPLRETTYRHLMRLHALSGDRAGALRIYHECVRVLEQELEILPAAETQTLYRTLLKVEPEITSSPVPRRVQHHEHVPLVGRKHEWKVLRQACQEIRMHRPQLVTIWGEAGVGKTRLVEELLRWARLRPGTVAYARAYAAEGALSYAPLADWLRSASLRSEMGSLEDVWRTELVRLLPALLTEQPDLPPPTPITEGWQRLRFHEALARAILSAPSPHVLVLDDLQWCDPETLNWLSYLLRFDSQASLLVVGTVRSEAVVEQHPLWSLRQQLQREAQWTELELLPLSFEETGALAAHLTGGESKEWAAQLFQETEGNPLFVVEMVRAGLISIKREGKTRTALALPPTVQSVITMRLDQLSSPARKLVQVASTIGRAFSADLLAAASELEEDVFVQGLDELWRRRLVREQGASYDFSHDKFREVAYTQLSRLQRCFLHHKVAQALEQGLTTGPHELAEQLAHHYQQAEIWEKAITYYKAAAEVAQNFFATEEALTNINKALTLVSRLPQERERVRHELILQCLKGSILWRGRGNSPESGDCYQRAVDLARELGEAVLLEHALDGLSRYHQGNASHLSANQLAHQRLKLAQARQDVAGLLVAYGRYGVSCFYLGNFGEASLALEKQIRFCDEIQQLPTDRHVVALANACAWMGRARWFLGYPDQAYQYSEKAITLATTLPHQYSLFEAAPFCLRTYAYLRDWPRVQEMAGVLLDLSSTYDHPMRRGQSQIFLGYAYAQQGNPQGGIQLIQEGIRLWQAAGAHTHMTDNLSMLAEAFGLMGQWEEGLRLLGDALTLVEQSDERWWEAELLRLTGVFTLALSPDMEPEAESFYLRAIQVAQQQKAKSLELRAAVSLSQLWQHQGLHEKAGRLLSQMCSCFTEGFGTHDLREAKARIAALA